MTQEVEDENGQIHEFPDEATPEQMKSALASLTAPVSTPKEPSKLDEQQYVKTARTLQDLAGGAAGQLQRLGVGLGEGGQWIGSQMEKIPGFKSLQQSVQRATGLSVPDPNIREMSGIDDASGKYDLRNIMSHDPDSLASSIGGILPQALAGGASLPGQIASAGASKLLTSAPDEESFMGYGPKGKLSNALEEMLGTGVGGKAIEYAAPAVAKTVKGVTSLVNPETWTSIKNTIRPGTLANKIQKSLSGETTQISENAKNQADYISHEANKKINEIQQDSESKIGDLNSQIKQKSSEVVSDLGKGNVNTEQNAAETADKIRALHDPAAANASSYYDYVIDQTRKEVAAANKSGNPSRGHIYNESDPLISTSPSEGRVREVVKGMNLGDIGDNFVKNPTFENAHLVKQELGYKAADIRGLPKKTPEEKLQLAQYDNAYHQLGRDMMTYLERFPNKNVDLISKWKTGDKLFQEDVLPFRSNPKLREITMPTKSGGGRSRYVKNIHQAFEHPGASDIVNPDGSVTPGAGTKLMGKLPQDLKDQILFNKMGAPSENDIPSLVKGVREAERKGFAGLVKPELKDALNDILAKQDQAELIAKNAKQQARKIAFDAKQHAKEVSGKAKSIVESKKSAAQPEIDRLNKNSSTVKKVLGAMVTVPMLGEGVNYVERNF